MKAFWLLALVSCCSLSFVAGSRFVCYFPNWTTYREGEGKFKVENVDPQLCTDLIYAFAILNGNTYQIQSVDPWADIDLKGYADFVGLKQKNTKLKTTIAIGGWNDSHDGTGKYSIMVADPAKRKIFIDSILAFIKLYKFDGVDLDWEYPITSSDKAGFAEFFKELRTTLGKDYIISVAVPVNQTVINLGYDIPVINQNVDYINLMAYDMHGPWESQTDHHAPLYKRPDETIENNADSAVNYWIENGLSPEKINLGIPLYGQTWTLGYSVDAEYLALAANHPAGPPGPYVGLAGTLGYNEICEYINAGSWQSVEDPEHLNGPYAFSFGTPNGWVGYDDLVMASVKSQYVLDNKLGGAMVWDMSTDDFLNKCGDGPNPMMTTISEIVVDKGSRFVCYFPNWTIYRLGNGKYSVDNIDASLCTDLIYSFAVLSNTTNEIKVFDPDADITKGQYAQFVALKKQNPNLKTTIAIGGWDDSHDNTNKYSYMVASQENRTIFIQSVLQFLEDYKFDGLDLDWEYPGTLSTDKEGFGNLLRELRTAFTDKKYLLSVAVAVNKTVIDNGYDVEAMNEAADYINIMAYDMHGPWEPLTDHHAPLYKRSWDTDDTNNIDYIINYWQEKGLEASKINMGIPLYGKSWNLNYTYTSDPDFPAPGIGQGSAGPITKQAGFLGYNEICKYVKNDKWNVVVDPDHLIGPYASSPFISSEHPMIWVGYDDPEMASVKSRYVLDKKIGGAMVWDLSTDDFRNICGFGANPITSSISRIILAETTNTSTTATTPASSTTAKTTISTSSANTENTAPASSTAVETTISTSSANTENTAPASSTTAKTTISTSSANTENTTPASSTAVETATSTSSANTKTTTRTPTTKLSTISKASTTTKISTTTSVTESTTQSESNALRMTPHSRSLFLAVAFVLTLMYITV